MADQRHLEDELWVVHGVAVEFVTFSDVEKNFYLDDEKNLRCKLHGSSDDNNKISVVYYRAGYTPSDYPTEMEWKMRSLIESSTAIKCPSIAYQLAGTKKIQQGDICYTCY